MVMVSMVFCLGLPEAQATVVFDDGGTHALDTLLEDRVEVRNSPIGEPTILNVVTGGLINYNLFVYNSSQANISGGSIGNYLYAGDSSQINISGGSIGNYLDVRDSSQVNISSGSIGRDLGALQNSRVRISGGSIGRYLYAWDRSQITIDGSGFNYPYGTLTGSGLLTGTLASGDLINNYFYTYDAARIVLVPEPATLLLLGLGVVMVRRKC